MKGISKLIRRSSAVNQRFSFAISDVFVQLYAPVEDVIPVSSSDSRFAGKGLSIRYSWKRGTQFLSSNSVDLEDLSLHQFSWEGQYLKLSCTMYQDARSQKFLSKDSQIVIQVLTKNGEEIGPIGVVNLDLAKFANSEEQEVTLAIEKCKDKQGTCSFFISARREKSLGLERESGSIEEQLNQLHLEQDAISPRRNTEFVSSSPLSDSHASGRRSLFLVKQQEVAIAKLTLEKEELLKKQSNLEQNVRDLQRKLALKEEEVLGVEKLKSDRDLAAQKLSKSKDDVKKLREMLRKKELEHLLEVQQLYQLKSDWMNICQKLTEEREFIEEKKASNELLEQKLERESLAAELRLASSQIVSLNKTIEMQKSQLLELESQEAQVGSLSAEILNLENSVEQSNKMKLELTARLTEFESEKERLCTEISELKNELHRVKEENAELLSRLSESNHVENQKPNYEIEKDLLLERISKLEEDYKQLQNNFRIAELKYEEAAGRCENENVQVDSPVTDPQEPIEEKIEKADADGTSFSEVMSELRDTISSFTGQNDRPRSKSKGKRGKRKSSRPPKTDLGSPKEDLKAKLSEFEEHYIKNEKKYSDMQAEVEKYKTSTANMEAQLVKVKIELINAVDRMNSLESENIKLLEYFHSKESQDSRKR